MKFSEIRKTVLKTGDPLPTVLAVVQNLAEEDVPATPRMIALDPFSPEASQIEPNRAALRKDLNGRDGRWGLNGNEPHWRRREKGVGE